MYVFYFFAVLLICLGLVSLRGGFLYLAYVRRELNQEPSRYTPFASIIAPTRGLDQGLEKNLAALFKQDYPAYEIIFVTDSVDDLSLTVVEAVRRACAERYGVAARVIIAGEATESGQKVHNLRASVGELDALSEAIAFVDTDARPHADWLRSLISPLANEEVGATTGYRWFVPVRGGFASHLRAVWNASIASALGENGDKNFCWGGATAIRRSVFEHLDVLGQWRGTLSDDFALMRVLRGAKLPIHFVPRCLTVALDDCTFSELLEFTTRQLKITRVYAAHFWKAVLLGSFLFVFGFFGGLALIIERAALGSTWQLPLALVVVIFVLGTAKAYIRWRAVLLAMKEHHTELKRGLLAHLLLWPLASLLYLYNALCAAFSRRINWRGITYELKSPTETVIIPHVRSRKIPQSNRTTRRAE
jgi:cellulose synthase/poly-beta-1,6-N-acetylglucosamine synthase-like glycosyltransferase